AFCLWLSDLTREQIMLPTDAQWQYAAQGTDGRRYPWGNDWDKSRCNSDYSGIGKTSPVTQFQGRGDSAFGVVDMIGNVWEWCVTDYDNLKSDPNSATTARVMRGGSWDTGFPDLLRVATRLKGLAYDRNNLTGFRIVRNSK